MTSFEQLPGVSFMESARDEESNIVDHVAIGEVFHEFTHRAHCLSLQVAKFRDKFVRGLVGEGAGGRVWREGGEEVPIGGAELEFDI